MGSKKLQQRPISYCLLLPREEHWEAQLALGVVLPRQPAVLTRGEWQPTLNHTDLRIAWPAHFPFVCQKIPIWLATIRSKAFGAACPIWGRGCCWAANALASRARVGCLATTGWNAGAWRWLLSWRGQNTKQQPLMGTCNAYLGRTHTDGTTLQQPSTSRIVLYLYTESESNS